MNQDYHLPRFMIMCPTVTRYFRPPPSEKKSSSSMNMQFHFDGWPLSLTLLLLESIVYETIAF